MFETASSIFFCCIFGIAKYPMARKVNSLRESTPNLTYLPSTLPNQSALLAESYALPASWGRDVLRRTEVASTQYHVTCANYAVSIKQAIQTGTLALGPGRIGRMNLLGLDSVKPVGTGSQAQKFWNDQFKLGRAIENYLAKSPSLPPSRAPIDEGIEQITDIREHTSSGYSVPGDLWPLYDDFANYDVVTGAVPMYAEQQKAMALAVTFGMPAIQDPFIQVVDKTGFA
ncbi:hypothetical protein FB451DRAFT_1366152 [Mycena latifolia]|nr:hypothetical protein FB451DRAFT_1366152 [Mycena latifolia]